tara:strand:- start:2249 stop:2686 length:438 start_codon:yes stop_codon:yes gene_type:complete
MAINYAKHDDEFYGVFKLVSGEEVLAKAVLTNQDNETLCFLQDPVCIQVVNQDMGKGKVLRGMGFHKWMQLSDEDFFIVREKDVLSVASMSKEVTFMYEGFLANEEPPSKKEERSARRETQLENTQGYIGSIKHARQIFEKLYYS